MTMNLFIALFTTVLVAISALLFAKLRHQQLQVRRCEARLARLEDDAGRERCRILELNNKRELLADAVQGGTTAVESVHRLIARTTFDLLERIAEDDKSREGYRQARQFHDEASAGIYRAIRTTNTQVHAIAEGFIHLTRKRRQSTPERPRPPRNPVTRLPPKDD
ncbi:MAG: hypothetical protein LAT63_09560 [Marinobacter sp.]|nr:hypothetical protein [Marinobacter sp.]